jgi:micrococcal nuclease
MRYLLGLLLCCLSINAATINGRVVGVADGDTITVLDATKKQHKIRFYGIDTPETAQAFGAKAKQFTSSLCFGKQVSVDVRDTDRYGRTVGVVTIDGGEAVNSALVGACKRRPKSAA